MRIDGSAVSSTCSQTGCMSFVDIDKLARLSLDGADQGMLDLLNCCEVTVFNSNVNDYYFDPQKWHVFRY